MAARRLSHLRDSGSHITHHIRFRYSIYGTYQLANLDKKIYTRDHLATCVLQDLLRHFEAYPLMMEVALRVACMLLISKHFCSYVCVRVRYPDHELWIWGALGVFRSCVEESQTLLVSCS